MAKIFDVRNSGGVLVVLGDSMVIPISNSYSLNAVPGAIRFNETSGALEVFAPNSSQDNVWSPLVTAADITADVDNYYLPITGGTVEGNLTVTGNITSNGTIIASYISGESVSALYAADLAERYHADAHYDAGTVLIVGGDHEVTTTDVVAHHSVAGVVSTNPAYKMNIMAGEDDTHPYLALKGKVPCKVIGPVKKGDHLCTSSVPGYAMTVPAISVDPRSCVGIALESCPEGKFEIEIMV